MGAGSSDPRGRRLETETRPAIPIRAIWAQPLPRTKEALAVQIRRISRARASRPLELQRSCSTTVRS